MPANNVSSNDKNLLEMIAGSQTPYTIPYNQRPYKWSQPNWEGLWTSIFSEDDYSRFLGTIILLNEVEDNEIFIFDGQQRITTLTILIKAAIEIVFDKGDQATSGQMYSLIQIVTTGEKRLIVSENLKDYFDNNIQSIPGNKPSQGSSKYEKEIYKAYKFFKSECEKYIKDKCNDSGSVFWKKFKKRLQEIELVELSIKDMVLGIEIFESVNATGEKLDASELVKNILVRYAPNNAADIHDKWTTLNDKVAESGFKMVDFLHYYWISKHSYVGKNKLFQTMKSKFSGSAQKWKTFFEEFDQSVHTLHNISVGLTGSTFNSRYSESSNNPAIISKIVNYLKALQLVSNKSWVIPIFSLLNYELKTNKFPKPGGGKHSYIASKFHNLLEKHFVFSFVHFNVLSLPTRDYTPAMYRLAQMINKAHADHPQDPKESTKKIKKIFEQHYKGSSQPTQTRPFTWPNNYVSKQIKEWQTAQLKFEEGVNKLKYDPKTNFLLKMVFNDIAVKIFDNNSIDFNNNSFEHYLPQDPSNWGISEDVAKSHMHKIGNLLWINRNVNSGDLGNKPHKEKLEALIDNQTKLDGFSKNFIKVHQSGTEYNFEKIDETHLKNSDFNSDPSEIDKRTKLIAGYMFKVYVKSMADWIGLDLERLLSQ